MSFAWDHKQRLFHIIPITPYFFCSALAFILRNHLILSIFSIHFTVFNLALTFNLAKLYILWSIQKFRIMIFHNFNNKIPYLSILFIYCRILKIYYWSEDIYFLVIFKFCDFYFIIKLLKCKNSLSLPKFSELEHDYISTS